MKDLESGKEKSTYADFVFIGAGGGALPLLDKYDIQKVKGMVDSRLVDNGCGAITQK